ncbi:DUF3054 domain-containing protein [Humibacter ginsenosidimutans]|uniref:DUF3054 domain-containing protein n=1 Tax=Humibacter ginsenosidimutans TaxID=2599293 RepID=A0A5B8M1A7_9MICO|nr:DUF3054 domain-containing protein [Humibacter ginsenosidimutans]
MTRPRLADVTDAPSENVSVPRTLRSTTGGIVTAAVIDVVLVLAFVLIGRGSHGENIVGGAFTTFWPFAAGLVVGWIVCLAWRRPFALWPTGVVAWAATLVIGMLLRVVSGQGVAVSFVIVAAIVLAVFLIGWRAVALPIRTRARRRG